VADHKFVQGGGVGGGGGVSGFGGVGVLGEKVFGGVGMRTEKIKKLRKGSDGMLIGGRGGTQDRSLKSRTRGGRSDYSTPIILMQTIQP